MSKPRWIPSDTQTLDELVAMHGPYKVFSHLYALAKKYAREEVETDKDREFQRECQNFISHMQDEPTPTT
jgi:hypothetical protein